MTLPQNVELLAKHHRQDMVIESSALSPQRTRRIHMLQHNTPEGGCGLSTYAADATPFEETKNARCRRLGTNRERRRQAHKVRSTPHPYTLTPTFALTPTLTLTGARDENFHTLPPQGPPCQDDRQASTRATGVAAKGAAGVATTPGPQHGPVGLSRRP